MACGHNHDEILFRQLPHVPERIIALEAEVAEKDKRIAELEAENAELRAKLHDLKYWSAQEALSQRAEQESDNG